MSKTIDNLYVLHNNPFLLSSIIVEFYNSYVGKQKKDILLAYIVFPLTLYESSKVALSRSNKSRTLRTFLKNKDCLIGLSDRVEEFKKLTNLCIQLAIDEGLITINNELSISVNEKYNRKAYVNISEYLKAASNAAKMLRDNEITYVFRNLGLKKI